MAKRFTDSDKWKDDWYISLANDDKVVWQWLLDNCTHTGLCKRSMGLLNLMCRTNYSEDDILFKMSGRIVILENYWFIPKFIKFQYSTLHSAKPAIVSVVKDLFKYNLTSMIPKSFGNDYIIIEKSFDNHCKMIKDKDKDKDKDKGGVGEKLKAVSFDDNFEFVTFNDGSSQILGVQQKELAQGGMLKLSSIVKNSIY